MAEKKDKHFINKPFFKGGARGIKAFVKNNLRYPAQALENRIEGTVHIRYTVDHNGTVIQAKVISGISAECDTEALRLVNLLKFTVTRRNRVKVKFHKKIQIHFRLPPPPELPFATQYQYEYIPKKDKSPTPKTNHSYQITFES